MIATDNRFVINRKIENIILLKGLSPSHFADEINVPRSSISHILADRNKPSLEIIHKIIKKYPDISFDWLMDGIENSSDIGIQKSDNQENNQYKRLVNRDLDFNTKNNPEYVTPRPNVERYKNRITERRPANNLPEYENNNVNINSQINKVVARVMVFYTDNTFDTFEAKK